MTWLKGSAIALAGAVGLGVAGLAAWEPFFAHAAAAPAAPRTYAAEIIRDDYGVPHIYGDTDPDVAFGVAVAHAEDDFFTLQDVIAMSRGRYGAIAGEDGAKVDFVYHLIDARGTAAREFPKLPRETRALLEAYAGPQPLCQPTSRRDQAGGSLPGEWRGYRGGLCAASAVLLRA